MNRAPRCRRSKLGGRSRRTPSWPRSGQSGPPRLGQRAAKAAGVDPKARAYADRAEAQAAEEERKAQKTAIEAAEAAANAPVPDYAKSATGGGYGSDTKGPHHEIEIEDECKPVCPKDLVRATMTTCGKFCADDHSKDKC